MERRTCQNGGSGTEVLRNIIRGEVNGNNEKKGAILP